MVEEFNSWDSYLWEPGGAVLRNLYGERDGAALARREYAEVAKQQFKVESGVTNVLRTYDIRHLQAIHRELFKNIFEWAGEFRTVPIFKPPLEFAEPADIGKYLADAERIVRDTPWETLNRHEFAAAAATVFAYVNHAHPFREGNGRASKLFMQHVSELSAFRLEYKPELSGVSQELWDQASAMSRPDLGSYKPVPDSLVPVFERLAVARERTGLW
ncbi:MAG: Fic/DOC family protein [Gulosibacter sp.]|uniref:Fic/DOC family protein n=1 Tax=Gulosibacter sp. TaxID=2817531 RepID=UPI003F929787